MHPQDSQFLSSSFEALLYCAPLQFPKPPLPQICSTPPVQTSVGREFDFVNNLRFMVSKSSNKRTSSRIYLQTSKNWQFLSKNWQRMDNFFKGEFFDSVLVYFRTMVMNQT